MSGYRLKAVVREGGAKPPLLAEAVEKLRPEAVLNFGFYYEWTFRCRLRSMPGQDLHFLPVRLSFSRIDQAIISLGGGLETSLARRLRFCTVAVSRNSSFAPDRPRNLSLVIAKLRFASPNNLSIFLRPRADWL